MKIDINAILADKLFTKRLTFVALAIMFLLIGNIFQYNYNPAKWMTYRDFDVPEQKNFINYLYPGVEDMSTGTEYQFEEKHWVLFFIIILGFFPLMLFLRMVKDKDVKLKVHRYITQWMTFVIARLGILRVTGVCPVKRTGLGVFPFMNCQSCELATGACPLGTLQVSMLNKEIPWALFGQLLLTGILSGRLICGWLCPFGFLTDIFGKLPGRKLKLNLKFTYFKYVYMAVLVISTIAYYFKGQSDILFYCSFLCPVGFFYGVLEYALTTSLPAVIKQFPYFHIMLVYHFLMGGVFIIGTMKLGGRFFCKFACPLGAFYGLFNRVSLLRLTLNNNKCRGCKACEKVCPMEISVLDESMLSRSSCILCLRCKKVCPSKKIDFKASFSFNKKRAAAGISSAAIKKGKRAARPVNLVKLN